MGETIWNPWATCTFEPLGWTMHVGPGSLSILLTQLLIHLTSQVKMDPSRGFLMMKAFKCRMLASTAFLFPFWGPQGPADANLGSSTLTPCCGEGGALLGRAHHTSCMNAGWYYSDGTDSPLSSHLHYKQSGIILGLQRRQWGTAKQACEVLLNHFLSSYCGLCTDTVSVGWQWFAHSCVNHDKKFRTLHCINERKQRWTNTLHNMLIVLVSAEI